MLGTIWAAYGYFVRHADNVTFKNCTTKAQYSDIREPLVSVDSDVKQLYTVEFESVGGTAVDEQTVESGKTVQKPAEPTKNGYRFDGWYTSNDYSKAWNFETDKINSKTVLYAKWSSI